MSFNDEGNGASDSSLANYKVLRVGDIAFEGHQNKTYPYGRFVLNDVGTGIMSPRFTCLRPKTEQVIEFWKYYINDEYVMNRILVFATKAGTMMNELVIDDFNQQCVHVPAEQEQTAIGRLFTALDSLIAAEQRKLSLLEDKKNAYLQELFSEAFIDQHSWNVTQLEDVASLIKRKNKEQEITCVYTNSAEYGIVPQAQFFDRDIASREHLENYTIIEQNDFIYNPRISKEAPYGPIRRNKNASIGVVSPLYTVFRLKSIDPTFMEYFFQSNIWHKFMQLNGDTGARSDRFAIKDSVFLRMPIAYPTNDAQKRIGAFFQQLDTLIKTETHKIQLLQQKKKGLLQQMFI